MPREGRADTAWRQRLSKATEELLAGGRVVRYGEPGQEHFCRPDELLVVTAAVPDLAAALKDVGAQPYDDDGRSVGVTRFGLPGGTDVHEAVLSLRRQGPVRAVAPNAVLFGAPKIRGCPGRPPAPAAGLDLAEGKDGAGVLIAVVDTGQAESSLAIPWMSRHVVVDPADLDLLDTSPGDGRLDLEAGHGTFIAGIVAQVAPGAKVLALKALDPSGTTDDLTAARRVRNAVDAGADVINLSFGGYTHSDEGLLALTAVLEEIERSKGPVVVAAAGNDALDRPFHPAAHRSVVGVAAMGTRKRRAAFSNFGPWVDACAEGDRLRSTYVIGTTTTDSDGDGNDDEFVEPNALWSGTSFAAPQVAAAVARRMSTHGESSREAVEALVRAPGLMRRPGMGVHVVTPVRGHPAP
ncbi:MAG: S8 family serine peptidase [Mycobacteriales bacterium]|nr:S8 family serine peptidase [Mycobacteriales bacterium]